MRDLNNFRPINEIEKSIINSSLQKFSVELISYIEQEKYKFYIYIRVEKKRVSYPSIFLLSHENSIILEEKLTNESVNSAGTSFGFIKEGEFRISLEGAEFLFKNNLIQDRNILKVNKKGEKAVLYGNPIVKGFVSDLRTDLQKNTLMWVINESGELLALALLEIDISILKLINQEDFVAKNLIDKGNYLRRKQ
jgi:ribosome biogenesis protein Nip4